MSRVSYSMISNSEKETCDFAKQFSTCLKGGEILALVGDLGSGKTVFTKGLAKALGVAQTVTSPTFVLLKVYPTKKGVLAHLDAYRLSGGQALVDIGVEEYFNRPDAITVIEWADRVADILPAKTIKINFKALTGDKREIVVG